MASLGQISINNVLLHEVNADPRTGSGVTSDLGDVAIATDGSGVYQKIGTSDTSWQLLVGTAQVANQHTTNSNVSDVVVQAPSSNRILNSIGSTTYCQVSSTGVGVGFSTNDQSASALLEMRSTTQGFLPPRMTSAQRQAISSPANGLVVYDTTLNTLCYYAGNTWRYEIYRVLSSAASSTSTTYTNIGGEFTIDLEAGRYLFSLHGFFQTAATGTGIGVRLGNGTATLSTVFIDWHITQAANGTAKNFQISQVAATTDVTSASVVAAATNYPIFGLGFFVKNAGTVAVQLRSEVSGSAATLEAGTIVKIERVGNT